MSSSSLRIAFAGTPDFAVPALRALAGSGQELVGVLTQPDRPKGRGQKTSASPVKQVALELGVPVSQPITLKTAEGAADLQSWRPDILVVVAYGLILPQSILDLPRLGCLNIHGSLLPRWRGAAPIHRALLAGDAETGVTIMKMDAGLDTGPMLLERRTPISREDTSGSLHDRLAALGADALVEAIEGWATGRLQPQPQPTDGVTYASKIEKSEALIDWSQDAEQIERQVRAFNPWPIAETRLNGEQLRIYKARATQDGNAFERRTADAGKIVAGSDDAISVQCGIGSLNLLEVQRPGRRPISARDLAHSLTLSDRKSVV